MLFYLDKFASLTPSTRQLMASALRSHHPNWSGCAGWTLHHQQWQEWEWDSDVCRFLHSASAALMDQAHQCVCPLSLAFCWHFEPGYKWTTSMSTTEKRIQRIWLNLKIVCISNHTSPVSSLSDKKENRSTSALATWPQSLSVGRCL